MKRTLNRNIALAAAIAAVAAFSSPAFAEGNQAGQSTAVQDMMTGTTQESMMDGQNGFGGVMGSQGGLAGMMGGQNMGGQNGQSGNMGMMQNMMGMMMQMHSQGQSGGMGYMNGLDVFANKDTAALLAEFDADGNGSLSIAEFEALHSAAIREQMVDRFQALDNDGDGQITSAEIAEGASNMMPGGQEFGAGQNGMMGGNGGIADMMQNQNSNN